MKDGKEHGYIPVLKQQLADRRIDFAHRYAQGTATYGGTVEVFRGIIAQHVLGLPRPSYPGAKVLIQKRRS